MPQDQWSFSGRCLMLTYRLACVHKAFHLLEICFWYAGSTILPLDGKPCIVDPRIRHCESFRIAAIGTVVAQAGIINGRTGTSFTESLDFGAGQRRLKTRRLRGNFPDRPFLDRDLSAAHCATIFIRGHRAGAAIPLPPGSSPSMPIAKASSRCRP
jgi:hypothetical protein